MLLNVYDESQLAETARRGMENGVVEIIGFGWILSSIKVTFNI